MALEHRPDGEIVPVIGSSGSGKTILTMLEASRDPRLIVYDTDQQWWPKGAEPCKTIAELAARCATREPAHLAYVGPITPETFDGFCRVAFCWIRLAPATVVAEEIAGVTSPGKAPVAWGELVRRARKYGARVFAITQRPQECDKTAIGNAHRTICMRLKRAGDRRYMAEELGIDPEKLRALKPLEYYEQLGLEEPQFRRVRIPKAKAVPAKPVRVPDSIDQIRTDPE